MLIKVLNQRYSIVVQKLLHPTAQRLHFSKYDPHNTCQTTTCTTHVHGYAHARAHTRIPMQHTPLTRPHTFLKRTWPTEPLECSLTIHWNHSLLFPRTCGPDNYRTIYQFILSHFLALHSIYSNFKEYSPSWLPLP